MNILIANTSMANRKESQTRNKKVKLMNYNGIEAGCSVNVLFERPNNQRSAT